MDEMRGERVVEFGHGFEVISKTVHGHREEIVLIEHATLAKEIKLADAFEKTHAGELPRDAFWSAIQPVYASDPALFSRLHECRPLLTLLRHGRLEDHPVYIPVVRHPVYIPVVRHPPSNHVAAVPSPSSAILICIGLACVCLARRATRHAPKATR